MALPISSISLSNTFGQWVMVTQNIVNELNNLDNLLRKGYFVKDTGILEIKSPGTSLIVQNNAKFKSIEVTDGLFNGVEIKENSITFSTKTPRGTTLFGVNRGSGYNNAYIRWNETAKIWQIRDINSASLYHNIITANNTSSVITSGIVQLNDNYLSTSTTQAATINAVRKAYVDLLTKITDSVNTANASIRSISTISGIVLPNKGVISVTSTNGMAFSGASNTLTINSAQDLRTTASPTFNNTTSTLFKITSDTNNYFSAGNLALRNAAPVIGMRDTNGGCTWLHTNSGTFYVLANTNPDSTEWNQTAASYNIAENSWDFPSEVSIKSLGKTTVKSVAGTYSIENCEKIFLDAGGCTVNLPANPSNGNFVIIGVGNYVNTTIARNGSKIMGLLENMTIDKTNVSVSLIYTGSLFGWKIV